MSDPALAALEAKIVEFAHERDLREQQKRDDQLAKERQQDTARSIWSARKAELPTIVRSIDELLKRHGYAGLSVGAYDKKHADIDRVELAFKHSGHRHSKILLRLARSGDFTCSVGAAAEDAGFTIIPITQLTEDRLKEVLSQAVVACLRDQVLPSPA